MWEGGGIHGSHEALLLQAAGSGAGDGVYGHAPALLPPWLGPAAAPSYSYMAPHAPPGPFGADAAAAAGPFGFGVGGYCEGGGAGGVGQVGLFGPESPSQHHQGVAGGAALQHHGSRVVSGLLGTLQAELGRMTAKEIMDAKALAASRSHSEAERRRRQRINGHLAKLRSLLPNTTKTDKASLLAEVIENVKELKRQTSAVLAAGEGEREGEETAAQHHLILPTEADELAVDAAEDGEGRLVVRTSLCCEDRAGLIPDIARALAALRLRARRAEIATLGGRVRNVLLITADDEEEGQGERDDVEGDGDGCAGTSHRRHELVASIQEALRGVMDHKEDGSDTSSSSGGGGSIKRQRMSGIHKQGSL
ncbi:transcription factor bHLH30-like [Phragmites australis]|uniref:transcription factor bHLH30-like n=1 Tax=Phragmites australis TaxID=29695 RepID=UPI002D76FF8B|nr:transcription factor bHLH30-like [Phragmites australis]